jgi:hypothetical protein
VGGFIFPLAVAFVITAFVDAWFAPLTCSEKGAAVIPGYGLDREIMFWTFDAPLAIVGSVIISSRLMHRLLKSVV